MVASCMRFQAAAQSDRIACPPDRLESRLVRSFRYVVVVAGLSVGTGQFVDIAR
jgi:hypothetical protein